MKKMKFSNGSFIVHGITGLVKDRKVSAWFDNRGGLVDCEARDRNGSSRAISERETVIRARLKSIGATWKD